MRMSKKTRPRLCGCAAEKRILASRKPSFLLSEEIRLAEFRRNNEELLAG
jgi:hypothetical protein